MYSEKKGLARRTFHLRTLLLLVFFSTAAFLQVAGAQTSAESPGNGFGNTSDAQNVNITVEQISGITPPSNVDLTIGPGQLKSNVSKESDSPLKVTTNSASTRAIDVFVSNSASVTAKDLTLKVKKDSDSNWRYIYDETDDDPSPAKQIIEGIEGVHEAEYDLDFAANVGPGFNPESSPTFKVKYTLTSPN